MTCYWDLQWNVRSTLIYTYFPITFKYIYRVNSSHCTNKRYLIKRWCEVIFERERQNAFADAFKKFLCYFRCLWVIFPQHLWTCMIRTLWLFVSYWHMNYWLLMFKVDYIDYYHEAGFYCTFNYQST